MLFDVFPGPHLCSPLNVLLQDGSDGIPPPPSQITPNRALWFVLQVLPVDRHSIQGFHKTHDVTVLGGRASGEGGGRGEGKVGRREREGEGGWEGQGRERRGKERRREEKGE